jgi:hypothetical protein
MMFTSIYALVGVACLGVALGFLGSHIIDAQERAMSTVENQNKHKMLRVFAPSSSNISDDPITTTAKKTHNHHQSVAVFSLHCIPLFLLIFALAYLVGGESQWDWAETLYFIVVTGKSPICGSEQVKLKACPSMPYYIFISHAPLVFVCCRVLHRVRVRILLII